MAQGLPSSLDAAYEEAESTTFTIPKEVEDQLKKQAQETAQRNKASEQALELSPIPQDIGGASAGTGKVPYLSAFTQAAQKYNVPVNVLIGLAEQESRFKPTALGVQTEWGRAKGLMQYLDSTAAGMGINPYDPVQSIDAAARQLRQRLDKGYSMIDAAREHFAGPDRKKWGTKTHNYGIEVMQRAQKYQNIGAPAPSAQPAAQQQSKPSANPDPSRYRPLSADEIKRIEQAKKEGKSEIVLQVGMKPIKLGSNDDWDKRIAEQEAKKNIATDTGNLLMLGVGRLGESARELTHRIPITKPVAMLMDKIDEYFIGKTSEQIFAEANDHYTKKLSAPTAKARQKLWVVEPGDKLGDGTTSKGWNIGPAWKDPRAYYAGIVESVPELAVSMGGSLSLARGAFNTAIKSGATREAASKAAAKTATLAGSFIEGGLGGAHSAVEVRKKINELPDNVLQQSDVIKELMSGGMTLAQAKKEVAEKSATKAFVLAGVGTGVFGGLGDRAIAKIITEGSSSRIKSALSGAVAEGVFEEMPQSAAQQLAQNYAVQDADPNQRLMQGVANQAAGGLAVGAAMGGGIGVATHRAPQAQQAEQGEQDQAPDAQPDLTEEQVQIEQGTAPERKIGAIERAVNDGQDLDAAISAEIEAVTGQDNIEQLINQPNATPTDEGTSTATAEQWLGAPGTEVQVSPKEDPSSVYTVRVEGYQNGEVFARDSDGTPIQFGQEDIVSATPVNNQEIPNSSNSVTNGIKVESTEIPTLTDFGVTPAETKPATQADANLSSFEEITPQAAPDTPKAEPVEIESPEKTLAKMDEAELRARIKYLADQAKASGGWNKRLMEERRKVETQINKNQEQKIDDKPYFKWEGMSPAERMAAAEKAGINADTARDISSKAWGAIDKSITDQLTAKPAPKPKAAKAPEVKQLEAKKPEADYSDAILEQKQAATQEAAPFRQLIIDAHFNNPPMKAQLIQQEIKTGRPRHEVMKDVQGIVADIKAGKITAPAAAPQATKIEGKDLGDGWSEFSKDSGTIGIPRADMPQIKAEHRGAMVNFMNARGINHKEDTVAADSLKPTQKEFSREKVKKASEREGGDRSILVSKDGHVLDGHHQWMAAREKGEDVKVIRLDAPIKDLVDAAHEFPSSTIDESQSKPETKVKDTQPEKTDRPALPERYNVGPFSGKTKPINKTLYREMDAEGLNDLVRVTLTNGGGDLTKVFVTDNIDLAIGQGKNKGILVQMRGDAVSGEEHYKPGTNDLTGREYQTDFIGMDAIDQIHIPQGTKLRVFTRQLIQARFDRQNLDDGSVLFTRKGVDIGQPLNEMRMDNAAQTAAKTEKAQTNPKTEKSKKSQSDSVPNPYNENELRARVRDLNKRESDISEFNKKVEQEFPNLFLRAQELAKTAKLTAAGRRGNTNFKSLEFKGDDTYVSGDPWPNRPTEDEILQQAIWHLSQKDESNSPDPTVAKTTSQEKNQTDERGPLLGADGNPKWFMSEDKAQAFIEKKKLTDQYHVQKVNNRRFEIHPVESTAPTVAPTVAKTETAQPKKETSAVKATGTTVQAGDLIRGVNKHVYELVDIQYNDAGGVDNVTVRLVERRDGQKIEASPNSKRSLAEFSRTFGNYDLTRPAPKSQPSDFIQVISVSDKKAPTAEQIVEKAAEKAKPSANTLVSDDRAAELRARLKAKLSQLNSGIDPEILAIGAELAVYHIERGARTFAAFAKNVASDLDVSMDKVRPYLRGWYNGARDMIEDMGGTIEGMDSAETVRSELAKLTTTEENQNARTVQSENVPAGDQGGTQGNVTTGNRDSEPLAAGVAETSESTNRGEPVSNNTQGAGGSGTRGVQPGQSTPSTSRDSGTVRTGLSSADAVSGDTLNIIAADKAFKRIGFKAISDGLWHKREGKELAWKVEPTFDNKGLMLQAVEDGQAFDELRLDFNDTPKSDVAIYSDFAKQISNYIKSNENPATEADVDTRQADPATAETSPKPEIDQPADFDLANEEIGKGGLTKKYKDNIASIRILKAMQSEGRVATPEERKQIARYVGWGALKGVFDKDSKQWSKEYTELKELLTDAEYKAARASTLNAHYTSPTVVGGIFKALEQVGFTSGRVLEPSVGTGNFFGLMPAPMRKKSQLHGVELDPLTSQIAAALYPSAKIAQATGFQDYQVPSEYFDVAIGNPPFGSEPIVDSDRTPYSGSSIHNYFFAKSIDKLRPGGLLTMVVSHNFMDANSETTRKWISERANLVSAVRLPRTAFKENAGTDVVTDILVFQKKSDVEYRNGIGNDSWVKTGTQTLTDPKTGSEVEHRVSSYFLTNPNNVLGTPSAAGSMYRAAEYTVEPSGDLNSQLSDWASNLPANMYQPIERTHEPEGADVSVPDGVKVGSFFVGDNGSISVRGPDAMGNRTATEWTAPNAKAAERMKGMIGLRDSLREQMRLEKSADTTTEQIEANRTELNRQYDDFNKQYGFLNDQTNRRLFLDDTESALLLALEFDYDKGVSKAVAAREEIDPRNPSAVKADIFNRRVMFPPADNIKVSNAKDALLASLNYKARLDLPYMASLYDKTEAEIIQELGDVVYNDPINGYVMADEYLSGDVKTKLAEVQEAVKDNPDFKRNVEALKKVIPVDKLPSEIHAALGASFIPAELFEQFAKEVTGADHRVAYVKATGQWVIDPRGQTNDSLNVGKWGIAKMPATSIFARTMAGQGVVVTETVRLGGGKTETRVLEKETEAAREKQSALKAEWQRWLWSDPDRADRVASIYNEKMNRIVVRKYDGDHMTFPGMSPAIQLLEHQKNAVWRALQSRQVLLDHTVGAGKTFEIVALFMEMRRLGIARKPFIAVPNHLTLQWRSEFSRLYPAANVLAATPEDFSKGNREKFFSKIVTGDWDAVIVGHSSLKKISLPPETEKAVLEEQINEIADAIDQMKRERGDRNIIRDMEGIRARLAARMTQRVQNLGERDKVVTFDELGVDAFAIDELHEFKNLFYNSTMERVPGMGNPAGSDKAFDLFVKLQWMFNTFGDKAPIAGATGTPVSNSLVEMFNMQRLLQYPTLKKDGLHVFDAWAKQFGSVESLYEVAPSGTGYRQSSRFAKFKNLPALMSHYQTFADTVTLDDLKAQEEAQGKAFPVPKVFGGRPQNIVAKRSPNVASFMGTPELEIQDGHVQFGFNVAAGDRFEVKKSEQGDHLNVMIVQEIDGAEVTQHLGTAKTEEDARLMLVEQALSPKIYVDPKSILGQFSNLKELNKKTKGKVNALSLTGQANKAGLDYRLVDPTAPDFAGSKINMAVDRMMTTYHKWSADKGTQLIFCDLSVPKSARSGFGSKERRVYVRDEKGGIVHKKGTLHTAEGFEDLPHLVIKEGKEFAIYDAATGLRIRGQLPSKAVALEWTKQTLSDEAKRQRWIDARDDAGDLDQDAIDDYNNANEINTEETEAISLSDIAGASGAAGFSVYDDIKTKLIAKGVPEREIAFIHDYSTPVAKDKLFKAVNSGAIRFLLGSTPKMGAGTNVQKRLVGLHHIDAPWRPSDLEQREGRIIRRGNTLYERDPSGFEIEIYRYATEQTYDTRRWQILEHKSRGIEQLRNYDGSVNEIDDIEGEAANAADMKAAASGDPLILEETQLRNDVRRLESLQAAHADSTQMLFRRARDNQRFADEIGPRALEEFHDLQATADKNPVKKDQFAGLTMNGRKIADREDAVKAIQKEMVRVFAGGSDASFTYRGIEFTLDNTLGYVELNSPTGRLDSFDPSKDSLPSAAGFLTRFANYIARIPAHIDDLNAKIAEAQRDAVELREQANNTFAQADELTAAREAHKRVQRRLIAKGPDIPAKQKPLLDKAMEAQKSALRDQGLGDAMDEFVGSRQNSRGQATSTGTTVTEVREALVNRFGEKTIAKLEKDGTLSIIDVLNEQGVEGFTAGGKVTLVADALTAETIVPVFLHELGGHVGFQGVMKPQAQKNLMDQFNKLVAAKDPIALEAKRLAERETDTNVQQEEYLPYLVTVAARTQNKRPGILNLIARIVSAVKAWAVDRLGMNISLNANDVLALAERMVRKTGTAPQPSIAMGKRINRDSDIPRPIYNFSPASLWTALSQDNDVFTKRISNKTEIAEITKDLNPEFNIENVPPRSREHDATWMLTTADGITAKIIQGSGEVWIDVSNLRRGGGGKDIYNIVANYAYNNDLVFISDPSGLSDQGMTRRLENMLSSSIKFGTTRHLKPHDKQVKGNKLIPAIDWKVGDDIHNIEQMMIANYNAMKFIYPEISGIKYNPQTDSFEGIASGRMKKSLSREASTKIKRDDFAHLASAARSKPRHLSAEYTPTAGATTLERAVLIKTYLEGTALDRLAIKNRFALQGTPRLTGDNSILFSRADNYTGMSTRELSDQITAEYDGLKLGLHGEKNIVTLSRIVIPEVARNAGTGTAIMQRIIDWADQNGKTIALTPSSDFGGNKKRLTEFYKRFDFVENKGRNKDFEISEAMYREAGSSSAPDIRFSRADDDLGTVSQAEYDSKLNQWWKEAKQLPSDALTNSMRGWGLGLVPLRPMLKEIAKDIPAAQTYLRVKDKMDALRNEWHAKVDAVAQDWLKYRIKNREENRELMDIMHESTLEQVDPSMPFQSLMTPKEVISLKNPSMNANLRAELTAKMDLDAKREEAYDKLKIRYDDLSPEARSIFEKVRDAYSDMADAFDKTLLDNMEKAINVRIRKAEREYKREIERIKDEGMEGTERDNAVADAERTLKNAKTKIAWNRKARLTQLRQQFETQRLAGPYFPLARFGQLFVTVRDAKTGEIVSFSRFEKAQEQRRFADEMKQDKNHKVEVGALADAEATRKAVDPNFVADVEDILADLPNAEQIKDEVWQRYLESLPDMSIRKSRIHRKGRAGYISDAVRAFGHHLFHGSHQLARMTYSMDLEDALDQARDEARETKDPTRSALVVNEMDKRHQFVMNPTGGQLATWASSFAFVWYLAGSPKAALMNLFQTPIMGIPILAAYDGQKVNSIVRAGNQLSRALVDFTQGKGYAMRSTRLTAEELDAMEKGYETGIIEKTQGHELAGVAENGVEYNAMRERVMKVISWGFHHTERLNREVTFLAAYRIARNKGVPHEQAISDAGDLTWKTHFDYSNTSRPRLMHSDTMKILLVFRNFQLNMLFRLFRDIHQTMHGDSKEARREALTQLAGITGMMMLNAGITGTWLFGIAMLMAGLFLGDDEDPEEELKKGMVNILGPNLAGLALYGVPGHITGTALSESVGMPDLWFRSPDSEKEGEEALNYWMSQLLGAVPAIGFQIARGVDRIGKGEEYRGIETMLPKMLKDPMKSYRYATEGAKNMKGDTVAEVRWPDVVKQATGFTPARISEQYKINNLNYNKQQLILKSRKQLMDDYYKATQADDEKAVDEVISKIEKHNEKNPDQPITAKGLIQSAKTRQKGSETAVGGMRYNTKLRERILEDQAPSIYK